MSDNECVPAPGGTPFSPDEVIIYGVRLGSEDGDARITPGKNWAIRLAAEGEESEFVAAYGYAFEGHCYRFDQPKILAFRAADVLHSTDAQGCGFSDAGPGYRMWRVRSDCGMVEMTARSGIFEKLVLESGRAGRRPPNTYRAELQLAHRGGRLTGGGA